MLFTDNADRAAVPAADARAATPSAEVALSLEVLLDRYASSCSVTLSDDKAAAGVPNAGVWLVRAHDRASRHVLASLTRMYRTLSWRYWCDRRAANAPRKPRPRHATRHPRPACMCMYTPRAVRRAAARACIARRLAQPHARAGRAALPHQHVERRAQGDVCAHRRGAPRTAALC